MSTEQDKDTFSLKRNRDGGLEGLGGPGLLLGSPEKKKRKSNAQPPSFAPLSEYAPPTNPSSDHLVACNPFDDSYSSPASLKPLSSASPYFGASQYPGFTGYGPPRMAPQIQNRMPAPYGSQFQIRNQQHLFTQGPMGMGFTRPPGFTYGHSEGLPFSNQPVFNNNGGMRVSPAPVFRENVNLASLILNQNHGPDPGFGSEPGTGMSRPGVGNASPGPGLFNQPVTPKLELNEGARKNGTPAKRDPDAQGKTKNKASEADKINGVLHGNPDALKKTPEHGAERNRRHKAGAHRNRPSSSAPSEPVYPCGICEVEVNDDQEAILCEASCQKWFHRLCTGMTETAYNLLTAESAAVWGCDACMKEKDASQLVKTRDAPGTTTAHSEGQT